MVRRLGLFAVIAALFATAACSSGGSDSASNDGQGIPDVEVIDLASDEPVALPSVAEPGLPTLVWFWAPH